MQVQVKQGETVTTVNCRTIPRVGEYVVFNGVRYEVLEVEQELAPEESDWANTPTPVVKIG